MNTIEWNPGRPWQEHPVTYRAAEMALLARWIEAGFSGSVVGLRGVGRSNLLGFLCHRPEVLSSYWRATPTGVNRIVILVPVDLNNLPARTLSAFYRLLLRAFYEMRHRLPPDLQEPATTLFLQHRADADPFLPQSALRELLFHAQARHYRVVLVMDRFDAFCRMITPAMGDTLIGLRDSFRDTLAYLVGVRQSLAYLEPLALADDLLRLLTAHTCYLGPFGTADARAMISQVTRTSPLPPTEGEIAQMLRLTGGYPTLVKAISDWWLLTTPRPRLAQWRAHLWRLPAVQRCLQEIWRSLTGEEQQALAALQQPAGSKETVVTQRRQRLAAVMATLCAKGICRSSPNAAGDEACILFGELFADYVNEVGMLSRGAIWIEEETDMLYQGDALLMGLAPKEQAILTFLAQQPRKRHTYTDLILNAWTERERYHGVTNDSLFQVVRSLRQKIEPDPTQPIYLVNWRGKPEGGYLLYPEGRPAEDD
ncbi:MAG: winged helix-turn-helix domain-containing protein [Caldilineaceae bacterium]